MKKIEGSTGAFSKAKEALDKIVDWMKPPKKLKKKFPLKIAIPPDIEWPAYTKFMKAVEDFVSIVSDTVEAIDMAGRFLARIPDLIVPMLIDMLVNYIKMLPIIQALNKSMQDELREIKQIIDLAIKEAESYKGFEQPDADIFGPSEAEKKRPENEETLFNVFPSVIDILIEEADKTDKRIFRLGRAIQNEIQLA